MDIIFWITKIFGNGKLFFDRSKSIIKLIISLYTEVSKYSTILAIFLILMIFLSILMIYYQWKQILNQKFTILLTIFYSFITYTIIIYFLILVPFTKITTPETINTEYDFQIGIDDMKTLFTEGGAYYSNKLDELSEGKMFGIFGEKDTGKSHTINKICSINLPSGYDPKSITKGFNIAKCNYFNTPIFAFDPEGTRRASKSLRSKIVLDEIRFDMSIDLPQVLIYIVNEQTSDDQKNIERIIYKLRKKKIGQVLKTLYLIHNFKHSKKLKEIEKLKNYQIKEINNCTNFINNTETGLETCLYEKKQSGSVFRIEHLIMAKENSEAGDYYNIKTLRYLRQIIQNNMNNKYNILEYVKKTLQKNFIKYVVIKKPNTNSPEDDKGTVNSNFIYSMFVKKIRDKLYAVFNINNEKEGENGLSINESFNDYELEVLPGKIRFKNYNKFNFSLVNFEFEKTGSIDSESIKTFSTVYELGESKDRYYFEMEVAGEVN
jgi:hypothetical protein